MDDKDKLIQCMQSFVENVDRLNKRMLTCATIIISVIVIAFSAAGTIIAFTYFTADYYYPTIETTDSQNTVNEIGGE